MARSSRSASTRSTWSIAFYLLMVLVGGLMLAKTAHAQDQEPIDGNAVTGPVIGIDLGYDCLLHGLHARHILTSLEQPTLVSVS
jgi:heat shock protein 5